VGGTAGACAQAALAARMEAAAKAAERTGDFICFLPFRSGNGTMTALTGRYGMNGE
jgi:hypothetical protein